MTVPNYLKDPIPALTKLFEARILKARTVFNNSRGKSHREPIPLAITTLNPNIERHFSIKCRDLSLVIVLVAIARILNTKQEFEKWSRHIFFIMMVAYLGSGKTTFGSMLWEAIKDY